MAAGVSLAERTLVTDPPLRIFCLHYLDRRPPTRLFPLLGGYLLWRKIINSKKNTKSSKADRQRSWRMEAYKAYANRATFKGIRGAYPAPALHNGSVRAGMLDYLLEYVDQHGKLPRGRHQVKMGQLHGWGYQLGKWEVNFPSIHPSNRYSFGEIR